MGPRRLVAKVGRLGTLPPHSTADELLLVARTILRTLLRAPTIMIQFNADPVLVGRMYSAFEKNGSVKFRRFLSVFAGEITNNHGTVGARGTMRGQILFEIEDYNPVNVSKLKNTVEYPDLEDLSCHGRLGGTDRSFLTHITNRFRCKQRVVFGAICDNGGTNHKQYCSYVRHLAGSADRRDGWPATL